MLNGPEFIRQTDLESSSCSYYYYYYSQEDGAEDFPRMRRRRRKIRDFRRGERGGQRQKASPIGAGGECRAQWKTPFVEERARERDIMLLHEIGNKGQIALLLLLRFTTTAKSWEMLSLTTSTTTTTTTNNPVLLLLCRYLFPLSPPSSSFCQIRGKGAKTLSDCY